MNRLVYLCATLFMAGCVDQSAPAADEAPTEPTASEPAMSGVPREVSDVAERLEGCNHFAGETGDNTPEREEQIGAAMEELRCGDELDRDVARIRATYAGNPAVEEALKEAMEL
ncbi:MAG TPA: hypothetical protein VF594_09095 [Rubricoccaceae bacterium]|jgi:hypothetical protein